ncbi:MAG: exonuclease VII large subunit [Bacteroidaceae bacterium]|nr:exonuclease VII large subunit [Bacteroidaceae bacterium]
MANSNVQQTTLARYYAPSEILNIFKGKLNADYYASRQGQLRVYMQGLFVLGKGQVYQGYCFDFIKDMSSNSYLSIKIPLNLRSQLKVNSLVNVAGILEYNVQNAYSSIQLILEVTWAETVQVNAVSKEDLRRNELLLQKNRSTRKNVDTLLESILYEDKKPMVGIIIAETAITETDFNRGLNAAAREKIQFVRHRCSFARPAELMNVLRQMDAKGFHAIALVRGGGNEKDWGALDNLEVLQTIVQMKTPVISAVGHPDEKAFIKNLVDKVLEVPFALGSYFSNMVNEVIEQRAKSKAALVNEVKKQYEEELTQARKQNATLTNQMKALTKAQEDGQKLHDEQLRKANEQNTELQKSLDKINNSITELTKKNAEYAKQVAKASSRIEELEGELKSRPNWFIVIIFSALSAAIAIYIFTQTHIVL